MHDNHAGHSCCAQPEGKHEQGSSLSFVDCLRIVCAGSLIILQYFSLLPNSQLVNILSILATLILAYPLFKDSWEALKERRMTMALSMSIAVLAALSLAESFTANVIIFFVLIAEEIEKFTIFRGQRALRSLSEFLPQKAFLRQNGQLAEVELSTIKTNDIVVCKPGSRLAVDGLVVAGHSFVDESAITGESLPVEKGPGSKVFAGSVNQSGSLEIKAESLGKETAFGRMVEAVRAASSSRAPIERLSDRMAAWLVYCSITLAFITFLVSYDLKQTISMIIVSGACGIAAGTPLAIYGALGRTARNGVVIKGGAFIEQLAKVNLVAFDKTGTLTYGRPRVVKMLVSDISTADWLLRTALTVESLSEHPAAKAIVEFAHEKGFSAGSCVDFNYIPGRGIRSIVGSDQVIIGNRKLMLENKIQLEPRFQKDSGYTEVFVASSGALLGAFYISDQVREESYQVVQALHNMGVKTVLLSGDTEATVQKVAEQLGICDYVSELKPEEKQLHIAKLAKDGYVVAMVGDGVNDAPALLSASVGIAMGSGTEVAMESADVVLIGSHLSKLVDCLKVARQTRRIILFNFFGTLAVDAVGMLLALLGVLSPIIAALIHVGSETAFILNSARLIPWANGMKEMLSSAKRKGSAN